MSLGASIVGDGNRARERRTGGRADATPRGPRRRPSSRDLAAFPPRLAISIPRAGIGRSRESTRYRDPPRFVLPPPPPSLFLSPRVSRESTASGNERPTSSRTRGEPHARFPAASDISAFCGIASEDRRRILVAAYSAPLRQILRPRSNASSRITIARTSSRCADNAPRETASRPWLRSAVCAGYFPFPRGYSRSRSRASPARIPVGSRCKRIVILVRSSDGRAPSCIATHGEIRIDSAESANTEYRRSTDRI